MKRGERDGSGGRGLSWTCLVGLVSARESRPGCGFSHVTLVAARVCACLCVFFFFFPFELLAGDPVPVRSRPLKSGCEPSLRYQAGGLVWDNIDKMARNGRDTAPGLQRSHVSHDEQVPQIFCLGVC